MGILTEIGGVLLDAYPHLKVDVHAPELRVTVEIREHAVHIHAGAVKGAGGLPVPTSGRAALLLSAAASTARWLSTGWQNAAWAWWRRILPACPRDYPALRRKWETLAQLLSQYTGPLPVLSGAINAGISTHCASKIILP